jgi:hypothetical protein
MLLSNFIDIGKIKMILNVSSALLRDLKLLLWDKGGTDFQTGT